MLILILAFGIGKAQSQTPLILEVHGHQKSVGQYGLLELSVKIQSSVQALTNYDSIALTARFVSPAGDMFLVDGFAYQHFLSQENGQLVLDGDPEFRIRFSPTITGKWNFGVYVHDVNGSDSLTGLSFLTITSGKGGFVSLSENGYLVNQKGQTVFLVGENIAWANQPDGSDRMGYYFEKLCGWEMNFAKLMMTPWGYQIEWQEGGLRNYMLRQKEAFLMDSIFRMADRKDIFLQLAFSIHNELNIGYPAEDWTSNPYNISNGGMCANAWDFFYHPLAKAAFKNRLRYIAARWGYSSQLIGWELLSEADNFPWYRQHSAQIAAWSGEMATYLRMIDPNQHPVSVGFALTTSNPEVWHQPDIGFTQLHIYDKVADIEGDVFRQSMLYRNRYQKAVLVGEFGLGHIGDSIAVWDPQGIGLHNSLWTSSLSGSMGAVVPWFWENYIDTLDLYRVFLPVARFMRDESLSDEITPMQLESLSDERFDMEVKPRFRELQRSPSASFQLFHTGQMIPAVDSLGTFLYGPSSVLAGLRNPPAFSGKWQFPSLLMVETGSQANNAVLQIRLNGTVVFEQGVSPFNQYIIAVPAGENIIQLDNRGTGLFSILEINSITFNDYLPSVRAFGLVSASRNLVWVHNRQYNWKNLYDNSKNPQPANGRILIPTGQGKFMVEWFNTRLGTIDSVSFHQTNEAVLELIIENLAHDLAIKTSPLTEIGIPVVEDPKVLLYPNPSDGMVNFAFTLQQAGEVRLEVFNALGKCIWHSRQHFEGAGHRHLLWPGKSQHGTVAEQGVYFYRIHFVIENQIVTGKMIRY